MASRENRAPTRATAGYTPISLDHRGRLFSLNGGDLFVIDAKHDH